MRRRSTPGATSRPNRLALQAEIVARVRAGLTVDDIARAMQVPRDWVATVLFRYRLDPEARSQIDAKLGDAA